MMEKVMVHGISKGPVAQARSEKDGEIQRDAKKWGEQTMMV
jgi:hypothetical protein